MSQKVAKVIKLVPAAILGLVLSSGWLASTLRAQNPPELQGGQLTSYQEALLNYKNGDYAAARKAIDAAEKEKPDDTATKILKARILTEQLDFAAGEKLLRPLFARNNPLEVDLALGDLFLRKHDFAGAGKYYEVALQAAPKDHEIMLKLIYARIGSTNLVEAEKLASELKPFDSHAAPLDPKSPNDPCYYFAKAALAQATGRTDEADQDIETARTLYGISSTNRYLKTYIEVTAAAAKSAEQATTPATTAESAAPSAPAGIVPADKDAPANPKP